MGDWEDKKEACLATWSTLMTLDQIAETYDHAKSMTMPALLYWNPADSSDMRKTKALSLAVAMDGRFQNFFAATLKGGVVPPAQVNGIRDVLVEAAATIEKLSQVVDGFYTFPKVSGP